MPKDLSPATQAAMRRLLDGPLPIDACDATMRILLQDGFNRQLVGIIGVLIAAVQGPATFNAEAFVLLDAGRELLGATKVEFH